jgi:hypothetical protein
MIFVAIFVAIFFVKKYNNYIYNKEKYLGKLMVRNIFVYIGLIIITGLIYAIIIKERYSNGILYNSLMGIIIILIFFFLNLFGSIQAIITMDKFYLMIISHVVFVGSTIMVIKFIAYLEKILKKKEIISEYLGIVLFGILIIIENIISYGLIKICIRIKTKIRSNGT